MNKDFEIACEMFKDFPNFCSEQQQILGLQAIAISDGVYSMAFIFNDGKLQESRIGKNNDDGIDELCRLDNRWTE
jgi:hypothetical protein